MPEPTYPLLIIDRLRMETDGDGVTTLVAGAGCPLRCRYCLNKSVLTREPELVTAEELYDRLKIDDLYFRATGGGPTFGGGESLLHAEFIARFREVCGPDWKIYAETSLNVAPEAVRTAAECVDGFIVDIKTADPDIYRAYTGGEPAPALDNLGLLFSLVPPERVRVRVPLIPGFNDEADRLKTEETVRALGAVNVEFFDYVIR